MLYSHYMKTLFSRVLYGIICILIIIILIIVIIKLTRSQTAVAPTLDNNNTTAISLVPGSAQISDVQTPPSLSATVISSGDVIHPPAPGVWDANAVADGLPATLSVGQHTIQLWVRGYMFFEGVAHFTIHDGETGRLIKTGTVSLIDSPEMTVNYMPASASFVLPASLSGHRIIFRVINDNPTGDEAYSKYWGKVIQVQ